MNRASPAQLNRAAQLLIAGANAAPRDPNFIPPAPPRPGLLDTIIKKPPVMDDMSSIKKPF